MILPNRAVLAISGDDRVDFLQGLITNGPSLTSNYACLLNAQGQFLHDFFIVPEGDRLLIDCEADRSEDLIRRLKQYRLRAKVEISVIDAATNVSFADPRHTDLGQRRLGGEIEGTYEEWDRKRIMLGVPDGSRDMVPEAALLLENNIDHLNGIDWNKGCYIGQEVTARMHFKGGVKKRLTPVRIDGAAPEVGSLVFSNGVDVGEMRSSCGDVGLALLRAGSEGVFTCEGAILILAA